MSKFFLQFFQNPVFLWIMIAVLIPIIIEWLLRRRRRRIPFAAMRYLLDSERPKKIRMQDRILLILRMLIIFLIVLALARPLIRPEDIISVDRKSRSVVVLLDSTYSNAQRVGNGTSFTTAQRMANDVIASLPEGVPVAIATVGHTAKVVQEFTADKGLLREKIEGLTVSHGSGAIAEGLEWVLEEVKKKSAEKGMRSSEVFVLSDLQVQTWTKGEEKGTGGKSARGLMPQLAQQAQVYVGLTGGERAPNLYIERFEPMDKVLAVGVATEFLVDIRATNLRGGSTIPARLSLYVNDEKKHFETFDVPAEGLQKKVRYQVLASGEQVIRVTIDGDSTPLDNERVYLAEVPEAMRILIMDQRGDSPAQDRPSVFWEFAAAPPSAPGRDRVSPFTVKTCTWDEAQKENFEEYGAVVLANVPDMPPGLAPRLMFYVREGGCLITFAGEEIMPYPYEQIFLGGDGILPAMFRDRSEGTGFLKTLVNASGNIDNAMLRFYRPMTPPGKAGAEVKPILASSGGEPIGFVRKVGSGMSVLLGIDPSLKWTTLPLVVDFPVFVQQLIRESMGDPNRLVNLKVGDPFSEPVLITTQHILLKGPGNRKVRLSPETATGQDIPRITYEDTDVQGIYHLEAPAGVLPRTRFAVSLDPSEADMTMWDSGDFSKEMTGKVTFLTPDQNIGKVVSAIYNLREFAGMILFGVFLLMLAESFLAMRFGLRKG